MLLIKAKSAPVGARRKRKSGWWLKDRPGHWKLLRTHVHQRFRAHGLHSNHPHAKLMHRAAVQLVRHFAGSRQRFSPELAGVILDNNYGHQGIPRFGSWKKSAISAVSKYLKEMGAVYGEASAKNQHKIAGDIAKWQAQVKNASMDFKSQVEMDAFVSRQFAARKKRVAHLLYAAREFIGPEMPMSQVPEQGFRGLCKAIIVKLYEHGPSGVTKEQLQIWEKAFGTVFDNAADNQAARLLPLAKALSHVNQRAEWKNEPKWFVYCCTRLAMKNDGMVDLAAVSKYMVNARKFHGSKNPPSPTYDQMDETVLSQIRLGMLEPQRAAVQQERIKPTKMSLIRKLFMKKKRLGKSLLWAGKETGGDTGEDRCDSRQINKTDGGKMKRRWARLLERRPDLKAKYGDKT